MRTILSTLLVTFTLLGVIALPFQFKPHPDYLNPVGWSIVGALICFGVFLAVVMAAQSMAGTSPVLITIFFFGGFGFSIGYKGVPPLLHHYAEVEVISAETTISNKRYSRRNYGCKRRLLFASSHSNIGKQLCVGSSTYHAAKQGDQFIVYGEQSWVGTEIIRFEKLAPNGAVIARGVPPSPYNTFISFGIAFGLLFLFAVFSSASRSASSNKQAKP